MKVTEQGERPLSELMGKEELLASLGLREEEEREALLWGEAAVSEESSDRPTDCVQLVRENGEGITCVPAAWPLGFEGPGSPAPA